jgi:hypothetical protein
VDAPAAPLSVKGGVSTTALASMATYSRKRAFAKVGSLVPGGCVLETRLVKEGSNLLYLFDVGDVDKSGVEEIDLSAMTGRLVRWVHVSPDHYAHERPILGAGIGFVP